MKSSRTHKLQLKTFDQVGIMVKDIDKVMEIWTRLFGFGPWSTREIDAMDDKIYPRKVKLAFTDVGQVEIELLQPIEDKLKQDWLDTHGEGIHHLAFRVDDLAKEVSSLEAQGVEPYMYYPGRFALLESGWSSGIIFELIQR